MKFTRELAIAAFKTVANNLPPISTAQNDETDSKDYKALDYTNGFIYSVKNPAYWVERIVGNGPYKGTRQRYRPPPKLLMTYEEAQQQMKSSSQRNDGLFNEPPEEI